MTTSKIAGEITSPLRPMESITVSFAESTIDGSNEMIDGSITNSKSPLEGAATATSLAISPPSIMESSLDMDLSESLFTLDDEDESFYWKQQQSMSMMNSSQEFAEEEKKEECLMVAPKTGLNYPTNTRQHQHINQLDGATMTKSKETDNHGIQQRYTELEQKLASTLTSNAQLTTEVDSLVQEQMNIKAELSLKLKNMEQLSHQYTMDANVQTTLHQEHVEKSTKTCNALQTEVQHLQHQLQLVNQKASDTAHQLQCELEEARVQYVYLSRDKETLGVELEQVRENYHVASKEVVRLKLLLRNVASPETKDVEQKLRRVVDSSQLANQALANALAVSEKDLAEAYDAKNKSARECDALRDCTVKLEDQTSFLSSKVKEMNKELKSSHGYIDELYADLQTATSIKSSPSPSEKKAAAAEIEKREMEWMELERGYSARVQELEGQLVLAKSTPEQHLGRKASTKVSIDAIMPVRQTHHFNNLPSIDDLKNQLNERQMPKQSAMATKNGGKSMRVLQLQASIEKSKQMEHGNNNENAAPPPTSALPPPKPMALHHHPSASSHSNNHVLPVKLRAGKQLNRVAAVKAAGGRKGLSEQLKRSRRFGEKNA